jgi:hypothetical protein
VFRYPLKIKEHKYIQVLYFSVHRSIEIELVEVKQQKNYSSENKKMYFSYAVFSYLLQLLVSVEYIIQSNVHRTKTMFQISSY